MFKRIFALVLLSIIALSMTACGVQIQIGGGNMVRGSGNVTNETREVSDFNSVAITGSGDATITMGDSESVVIEAEDNIIPLIETKILNGKLVIGMKPGTSISTTRPIRYTISAKNLNGVETTGSVDISIANPAKAESFSASTTGSGNIKLNELQAQTFNARTTGSGDINVANGKVESLTVTTSGSGDFIGTNLACGTVNATTSGSGNITMWAKDSLTGRTSGSGDIKYYGQPSVSRTESGSGRLRSLGNK
jgi:hypothetical protein